MDDKPRRPTLHLKFPAAAPSEPKIPVDMTPRAKRGTANVFIPEPRARPAFKPRPQHVAPPAAPVVKPVHAWKCKPCGTGFDVGPELADDDAVRCPSCNARVGRAKDFRSDPPTLAKVRARQVGKG